MSLGTGLAQGIPQPAAGTATAASGGDADCILDGDASAEGGEAVFGCDGAAGEEQVPVVPGADNTQEYRV